ncbi:MAG: PRC-barrel domain-containing protein [Fimbriimonas sp.]|nr:PRC-barrel domain-containing protein [Fimbriimonas sp.]
MKDKDFINKQVVSMADGAKVGTVKDLVFNCLDLKALVVQGERGEGLLAFTDIGTNGPDAVMIESYTVIDWNAGRVLGPESRNTEDLRKLSVVDADGNLLGHMHHITMDPKGHVKHIAVRTVGVFGIGANETLVAGSRVRAIGADMITVEKSRKG